MSGPFPFDPATWATLRQLLDEGQALPPAARAAWLDALPPAHAPLRERLRRLLDHAGDDPDSGAATSATATRTTTPAGRFDRLPALSAPDPAPAPPGPPPAVGPYRPIRLLGEGGMSSVWLAERTDVLLNRPVALKLPRAAWQHAGLAQRMAQEREILALLDHPNIARIYDAGVAGDGQPYLALELVDGVRIDTYCAERSLGVRARVALFLQVAGAVAHAHAKLVVHRDLKPSNILVTADGQARLLDFGIAKLVGDAQAGAADLTQGAARVMTPLYAAPEQVLGQPITTATDVYALGVVLYELLTGQRPCRPARDTAAALEEAILHAEPVRPSAAVADLRTARVLRGDLDTIVLKALKKAPTDRYATVNELADDLQSWLADRPVRARPDSARYRAWKFLRRNRLPLAVTAAVLMSLLAGLAAALWQADRARAEAAKANAIKDYLVGLFETNGIDQPDALRKRQQSVQQLLEQSAQTLSTALPNQPEVRDELQQVVGRLLHDLQLGEAAVRVRRQRAQQLAQRRAPALQQVDALRELARSESDLGALNAARATLVGAQALCTDAAVATHVPCRMVQVALGGVEFNERRLQPALDLVEPAVQALRAEAPGRIELAEALDLLGLLRSLHNRNDDALALVTESMAIRRVVWADQPVRLAVARFQLGRNLWAMRHLARAEAELREALRTLAAAMGPEHVTTARVEMNLGRLSLYLGLRDDALGHIQHATAVLLREGARIDPRERLEARVTLGNAWLLQGRLAEAGPALDEALALRRQLGEAALVDPTLDQSHARWLQDVGRYAEARAVLVAFRERAVRTFGPRHPEVAERSLRIARVWLAEGRLDEAQREIDAVFASADADEAVFGSVKHKAVLARVALLLEQGRADEAQPLIDAQRAAAAQSPRENQFRDVLFQVHELDARTAAQRGRHAQAQVEFDAAIALMASADSRHPYLAAVRAHYALSLADAGRPADARRQADLAAAALRAQPLAGEQFHRPLRAALRRLGP